jgi:hypothetical protein
VRRRKLGARWTAHQMRQIYADYSLPISPRDITIEEIKFFYEPMIASLCRLQKGK